MTKNKHEKEEQTVEYNGQTISHTLQVVDIVGQIFTELNEQARRF